MPDDVDRLVDELKALPLIDSADLSKPGAAFAAFDPVVAAILRAALVQVPHKQRRGKNRILFVQFVTEHFPEKRGRGDTKYAAKLWDFRCEVAKGKRTGPFVLAQNAAGEHLQPGPDGRPVLNLESLISDFRAAVDSLGDELRSAARCDEVADELARRKVTVAPIRDSATSVSVTNSETTLVLRPVLAAKAASGTN